MKMAIIIPGMVIACLPIFFGVFTTSAGAAPYEIVDTGQDVCFSSSAAITCPDVGDSFHGQDAQYDGNQPSFTVSADGLTVTDNISGLVWQRSPDTDLDGILDSPGDKLSWWNALDFPATLNAQNFGGYDDWRLPSIKELYSLIDFRGVDPSGYEGNDTSGLIPFIDTDAFEFEYGQAPFERVIDSQYWSSNEYVSTTMIGDHTVFGVNFADGRIKGYGTNFMGGDKTAFVLCCRGNTDYGINDFTDNEDGTVTDQATGLMWQQDDSATGMVWADALAYAESFDYAGHDDWRLPNVKELQSIVDYTRSPATHGTAAIDPVFNCTTVTNEAGDPDFAFYWSGTTHRNWTTEMPGGWGCYVAFGSALGYPFGSWVDVHGAGCQRSDPKDGDPDDWPNGNGPQGDAIRIFNFVRCVRDAGTASGVEDELPGMRSEKRLETSPNPFNPSIEVSFSVPTSGVVNVSVYDTQGRLVVELMREQLPAGEYQITWSGKDRNGQAAPSGVYLVFLKSAEGGITRKITLAK